MPRTLRARTKIERVRTALRHDEPDRIPLAEVYWTDFLERWRRELALPHDADPKHYYDLDIDIATPNLDPHVRPFEILKDSAGETTVRTGFGAVVRKVHEIPMPHYMAFDTDSIDKVRSFRFDDPWDDRRYFARGDDHLSGVGDRIARDVDPWIDRVRAMSADFATFGGVIEANEFMTRSIGQANALLWMGLYPDDIGCFAERINAFMTEAIKAQIDAAGGLLDGILIAGDVAYTNGMLFSPDYWRKHFKPGVKAMIEVAHDHGLPVLMHACGDMRAILDDLVEIGLDAIHPLECKAGQDVVDLRRRMGHRLAFVGNHDVEIWAHGDRQQLKACTLRKLNAAKGGGCIFGADHSVPSNVSGETYDYLIGLVREYGNYPLQLGDADIPLA